MVEGALHLRVVLLVFQPLVGKPFRGSHQGWLGFQVPQVPLATVLRLRHGGCGQDNDGIEHIQRGGRCVVLLQYLECQCRLLAGLRGLDQQRGRQGERGGGFSGQGLE